MRTRNSERLDYGSTQYDDYDGYKATTEESIFSSTSGQPSNRMSDNVTSRNSKYDFDYGGCMDDNASDDTYTMYDDGQWEMNSCSGAGSRTVQNRLESYRIGSNGIKSAQMAQNPQSTNQQTHFAMFRQTMPSQVGSGEVTTTSDFGRNMVKSATLVSSSTPTAGASTAKKSRLLPQPMVKSSTSRMLPKMPPMTNTAKHRVPLIRRNDSEYSDHDSVYSAYSYRPGAVSAIPFNEDYNYAYQSTDSLNTTAQSVLSEYGGGVGDRRSKMSAISGAVPIASGTLKSSSSSAAVASAATSSRRYNAFGSRTQPSSFDQEIDDELLPLDEFGFPSPTYRRNCDFSTSMHDSALYYGDNSGSTPTQTTPVHTSNRKRLPVAPSIGTTSTYGGTSATTKLLPEIPIKPPITTSFESSVTTPKKRLPVIGAAATGSGIDAMASATATSAIGYQYQHQQPHIISSSSNSNSVYNNNNNYNNDSINLNNNNKFIDKVSADDTCSSYNNMSFNFNDTNYDVTYGMDNKCDESSGSTYDNYGYIGPKSNEYSEYASAAPLLDPYDDKSYANNSFSIGGGNGFGGGDSSSSSSKKMTTTTIPTSTVSTHTTAINSSVLPHFARFSQ